MKLCMCKLEATLSQNAKDGGPTWLGDFRNKICKKRRRNTRGMLSGLVA